MIIFYAEIIPYLANVSSSWLLHPFDIILVVVDHFLYFMAQQELPGSSCTFPALVPVSEGWHLERFNESKLWSRKVLIAIWLSFL